MPSAIRAVLVVGFGSALSAQDVGVVIPPSHATQPGSGATSVPFGRPTGMRLQAAYDPLNFVRPSLAIQALELRLDEGRTAAGKRVDLELRTSTMPRPITGMRWSFAQNRGADESVALSRTIVDLPPLSTGQVPNPFHVRIPFDRGVVYAPQAGSLVVEFVVHGQEPGSYPLDAAWICDSPRGPYGPLGCGPPGGPVLGADSLTTRATWGGSLVLRVFDATPGAVSGLFFGVLEQGVWNGLPIPFDLTGLGAPGCHLSIDPLVTASRVADGAGVSIYDVFVPTDPRLRGSVVRFQGFSIEPGANLLGVTTSQPYKIEICGLEAVARLFAVGLEATTGQREIGSAPVVRLVLQ